MLLENRGQRLAIFRLHRRQIGNRLPVRCFGHDIVGQRGIVLAEILLYNSAPEIRHCIFLVLVRKALVRLVHGHIFLGQRGLLFVGQQQRMPVKLIGAGAGKLRARCQIAGLQRQIERLFAAIQSVQYGLRIDRVHTLPLDRKPVLRGLLLIGGHVLTRIRLGSRP